MRISIIGMGNIGFAFLEGVLKGGKVLAEDITVYDIEEHKTNAARTKFGVKISESISGLKKSDFLIIATKPKDVESVLKEVGDYSGVLVSFAAGVPLWFLKNYLKKSIRVMPNLSVKNDSGVFAVFFSDDVSDGEREALVDLLQSCGEVFEVSTDNDIDIFTAVSASGPGYLSLIFEAFEDASVRVGLPRSVARRVCVQTIIGSAKLFLENPNIKNEVMTPGGTTAEAVFHIEKSGLKGTIMEAVENAFKKCKEVSKLIE